MIAAFKGGAIAGTSLFMAASRSIDSVDDVQAGEIVLDTLPDSPCWDTTLNGGVGGVRSMTDAEAAAEESAMQATADQRAADLATIAVFKAGSSDQSNAALAGALQAAFRLLGL